MIFHKKFLILGFTLSIFMLLNFSEALGKALKKENPPTAKKTELQKAKHSSNGSSNKKKTSFSAKEAYKHSVNSLSWKTFTPTKVDSKERSKNHQVPKLSAKAHSQSINNAIPKPIHLSLPNQNPSISSTLPRKKDISEENLSLEPIVLRSPPTGEYAFSRYVKDPSTLVVFYKGREQEVKLIGIKKSLIFEGDRNNKALEKPNSEAIDKGVNAPEQPEDKATNYARRMIEKKMIRMKFDDKGPVRDSDGRLRVYIYRENGYFLNADLIKQGLAKVDKEDDFAFKDEFRTMEKEAREQNKGSWKP
ncbi:MAG: thermonuclease family protein [Candidatus Tectomicrobia bacterium]|uniref:Thermonuclease family protein n=1 Tax=Tectimicrobiota bacterium TaxID=2528274 RepID=A0A933GMA5_UNCTE|nr:thermonuclease family protein [Candidatus Tectomicrobia bacterium]